MPAIALGVCNTGHCSSATVYQKTILQICSRNGHAHRQLDKHIQLQSEELKKGGTAVGVNCDLAWDLQLTAYAQRAGPPAVDVREPIGVSGFTQV
ncbi:TPA: hypothetical protein ACH3X2_002155 [Trebouxia sp. C0005]